MGREPSFRHGRREMVSAEVDAKTGQIYSYNRYRFDRTGAPEVKSPISKQVAQNLAFETVSRLVPNRRGMEADIR